MGMTGKMLAITILAGLLLAAGCRDDKVLTDSKYWVPGMRLPPNAEVLSTTLKQPPSGAVTNPDAQEVQTITFKDGGGWDYVAGHVYKDTYRLGYREVGTRSVPDEKMGEFDPEQFVAKKQSYQFMRPGVKLTVTVQSLRQLSKRAADEGKYVIMISRPMF